MDMLQNVTKPVNEVCMGFIYNTPLVHVGTTPISKEIKNVKTLYHNAEIIPDEAHNTLKLTNQNKVKKVSVALRNTVELRTKGQHSRKKHFHDLF
jgi:diphthamide synthase subunit DPH2